MKFRVMAELSRQAKKRILNVAINGVTFNRVIFYGIFLIAVLISPLLAGQAKVAELRPQPVSFLGVDSVKIAGDLYLPVSPKAGKYPLVILLHMLGHDRTTYDGLVKALLAGNSGLAVLAIDLPGHGESKTRTDGKAVDFRQFSPRDWANVVDDVNKVIWDTQSLPCAKQIDGQKIVICGASIGANLALTVGAHNKRVQAIVMLSPGMGFVSGPADFTLREFNRPALLVAANDDPYARDACKLLSQASRVAKLRMFERAGHGTDMFAPHPELINEIVVWLKGQLKVK